MTNEVKRSYLGEQEDAKVGMILSGSQGYDMTWYTFFKVTKIIGKKFFEVTELEKEVEEGGNEHSWKVVPCTDVKEGAEVYRGYKSYCMHRGCRVEMWTVNKTKTQKISVGLWDGNPEQEHAEYR